MQSNVPKTRLAMMAVGDKVKMVGDDANRTFTVEGLREDGYCDLFCNGRPSVIACLSTEVRLVND